MLHWLWWSPNFRRGVEGVQSCSIMESHPILVLNTVPQKNDWNDERDDE